MLRNQTLSSSLSTSISTAVPSTIAQSLRGSAKRRLGADHADSSTRTGIWQLVAHTLRLPDSRRGFVLFLAAVTLISIGMILHLLLAISILESRIELSYLDAEYRGVRRESTTLIWAISQETTLTRVQERAIAAGYEPVYERRYVIQPVPSFSGAGAPLAADPQVTEQLTTNVDGN